MCGDIRPISDIENFSKAIKDIDQCFRQLHDELIGLGIDHLNKIEGQFGRDERLLDLRDAILYRRNTMRFHFLLLLRVHNSAVAELHSGIEKSKLPLGPIIMDRSAEEQFAVFDSIVFHAISLFDYIGNLIDLLCGSKKRTRMKWNGAVKAARDQNNQVSCSPVAPIVDHLDHEWINKLYKHRSKIIHYTADLGGRTLSITPGTYDLKIFAPPGLVSQFDELKQLSETNAITLHYAGSWLVRKTLKSCIEIIEALRQHLEENRRIPKGQEPIQRGSSHKT